MKPHSNAVSVQFVRGTECNAFDLAAHCLIALLGRADSKTPTMVGVARREIEHKAGGGEVL